MSPCLPISDNLESIVSFLTFFFLSLALSFNIFFYFKVFSYNEILEVYKNNVIAQSQEIKEAA